MVVVAILATIVVFWISGGFVTDVGACCHGMVQPLPEQAKLLQSAPHTPVKSFEIFCDDVSRYNTRPVQDCGVPTVKLGRRCLTTYITCTYLLYYHIVQAGRANASAKGIGGNTHIQS